MSPEEALWMGLYGHGAHEGVSRELELGERVVMAQEDEDSFGPHVIFLGKFPAETRRQHRPGRDGLKGGSR